MFFFLFGFHLKILTVDESKNSVNSQPRLPFLKPKPSTGSAFCSVTPNSITADSSACPTLCAQDVFRTLSQCKQTLSASISTQMLIESSTVERSRSPVQNPYDVGTAEIPEEIRSLLPPNNNVRAISPSRLVVFPPEMPPGYRAYSGRSKTSTPQPKREIDADAESPFAISASVYRAESSACRSTVECLEVSEENLTRESDEEEDGERITTDRPAAAAAAAAAEPPVEAAVTKRKAAAAVTEGNGTESPMLAALKTAPERSYSPLPTFVDASEFVATPSSDDGCEDERPTPTMSEALTIAPDRSYKELSEPNGRARRVGNNPVRYVHGYNNKKAPVAPLLLTRSLIYSPASLVDSEDEQIASLGLKSFPPVSDALKLSTAAGDFDRVESGPEHVDEPPPVFDEPGTVQEDTAVESSGHRVDVAARSPAPGARHPFTASGLHEPSDIPRYQQSIPENPHRAAVPGGGSSGPKPSIKNASFLKRETNVHGKVAPALGYEPSSLDGRPSKSVNVRPEAAKSMPADASPTAVPHVPAVEPVVPMPKTSLPAALLSKKLTCLTKKQQPKCIPTPLPVTDTGGQPTGRTGAGASAGLTAPRRGRGVLNPQNLTPGARVPLCGQCNSYIRGPFITALGKIWCPEHFVCTNEKCRRPLQDIGFVEEDNGLYCEYCFEQYLAPVCHKCSKKVKGDCLNAIGKQFHPECFNCTYCGKLFGNSPFFLEDSLPYCENDWNELFTTKCIACGFPIEAGDRWVEALNNNYHSPCFNCSKCKVNLEGQSFYAKGGRPYCKSHAR